MVTIHKDTLGIRKSISDSLTIARRDILRMKRQPDLILMGAMLGVFMLVLFNYAFGGVIAAGADVDYTQFLVPGMVILTALFGSSITGTAIAEDLGKGVIDRYCSLPMNRIAIIGGRVLSDIVRNILSIGLLLLVSFAIGFRTESIGAVVPILLIGVGIGFAFSWVNAMFGVGMKSVEAVQGISMFWLFPFMFASSVFTPTGDMPEWLQVFANNSPITTSSDAIRSFASGPVDYTALWATVLWIVGISVAFGVLSSILLKRRTEG